ncbi:MAG: helix-turn-helix domain-containing protein [Paraclostridium sp.]
MEKEQNKIKKYKIPNKDLSKLMKKNYEIWKQNGLSNNGYFIIFDGFLENNKLKQVSGGALKLYIYLGLNSKNMTGEVWHSIPRIAKYFGKSERTINNWISELEKLSLIKRMQKELNGVSYTYIQPYELPIKDK